MTAQTQENEGATTSSLKKKLDTEMEDEEDEHP